jgi:NADH-quinone oxidoreductase subunit J
MLTVFFSVLSAIYIFCALMVVFAKNPIYSVLYLILIFINTVCFFFLLGVEYLSFVFLIIYVGAIAVLFLFVVMMLNIKTIEYNENFLKYLPIGGLMLCLLFLEFCYIFDMDFLENMHINFKVSSNDLSLFWFDYVDEANTLSLFAVILYTYYSHLLIIAGLILLLAMIGSIMLTLTNIHRSYKDDVYKKISSDIYKSLRIINLKKK